MLVKFSVVSVIMVNKLMVKYHEINDPGQNVSNKV
jgi:hypothetical protein